MIVHKKRRSEGLYKIIVTFLKTNVFFYVIIALTFLQGLWYALTFRPVIFDEAIHVGFIELYSHRLNPFITQQLPSMDWLGDVTRNSTYLYYYLMSWPMKFLGLFTDSLTTKIIILRLLNIALFIGGLIVYRKLIIKVSGSAALANLTLLFLILTPAIAPLNGAINYDNAVFLLSGIILLLSVDILKSNKIDIIRLSCLIIVGCIGSLIKYETLALFAPVILYLGFDLWTKHRGQLMVALRDSYKKIGLYAGIILVTGLVVSVGLFIERPGYNLVKYHNVKPDCIKLIGATRCAQNYSVKRNIVALEHKSPDFQPKNPVQFMLDTWIPGMIVTQTVLLGGRQPSLTIIRFFYYLAAVLGSMLLIAYVRDFIKNKYYKFLLVMLGVYTLILAAHLYKGYASLGIPIAVSSRYLLPVMPLFIFFVGLSARELLRNMPKLALTTLVLSLLIMTQGGGIITYIMTNNSDFYWPNKTVKNVNQSLNKTFNRIIINR